MSQLFVVHEGGCWLWLGTLDRHGYGKFGRGYAHRAAYTAHYGEIPAGMSVLHRCDTPACVNPEHLFLGTRADNCRDRSAKGRSARRGWSPGPTEAQVAALRMERVPPLSIARWRERVEAGQRGCLLWVRQGNTDGYPVLTRDGREVRVSRLVYEHEVGAIPEGMRVFMLCGERRCVNPKHVLVAPPGTRTGLERPRRTRGALDADRVAAIRARLGTMSQRAIAREFGISQRTVIDIATGRTWK